jgi:hypothetical protein
MATNTDAFTYSDGELESVSGGVWVKLRTGGQTASITSNALGPGATNFDAPYRYNATYASAALYSQCRVAATVSGVSAFSLIINVNTHLDGARDYNICEFTDAGGGLANALIGKIVNGTFTSLDTVSGFAWAANDVVRFENDGSGNLRALINGTPISGLSATDTDNNAFFGVGIMPSTNDAGRLDDWEGGDLAAAGRTTKNTRAFPLGVNVGMGFGMGGL